MANTGLLRRKAEMTLLHPQLGETRRQELRNSSFWDPSLFESQLVKVKTSFSKKAPQKTFRVSHPTRISPFVVPTRKEAPTGNAPMGATPLKAVTNRFSREGENRTSEAPGVNSRKYLRFCYKAQEISLVAGQPPSLDRSHCSPPRLVAKSLKCDERCRLSSQRPQCPTLPTPHTKVGALT